MGVEYIFNSREGDILISPFSAYLPRISETKIEIMANTISICIRFPAEKTKNPNNQPIINIIAIMYNNPFILATIY
jgi:hypothetical protein